MDTGKFAKDMSANLREPYGGFDMDACIGFNARHPQRVALLREIFLKHLCKLHAREETLRSASLRARGGAAAAGAQRERLISVRLALGVHRIQDERERELQNGKVPARCYAAKKGTKRKRFPAEKASHPLAMMTRRLRSARRRQRFPRQLSR